MVDDFEPDCLTDSRVYINDVRVDAGKLDLFMRTEGALDITRYCEGTFFSPSYSGEDYASLLGTLRPDEQDLFDTLKVELLDHETQQYYLAFHGVVTGAGNTADGPSQEWHYRAQGPGHFLSKIPASTTFEKSDGYDIIKDVAAKLDEKLPFSIDAIDDEGTPVVREPSVETTTDNTVRVTDIVVGTLTSKTFQKNKHTLADVVTWMVDHEDLRVWLEPTQEGVSFVTTFDPAIVDHEAHYLGGNARVIENDALVEMKPANTVAVNGKAKKSYVGRAKENATWGLLDADKQFARAKARHTKLYERAGETELHVGVDRVVDGETKVEVGNEARKILRNEIEEATAGDMTTHLRGNVTPMDTITAKPTCNDSVAIDDTPITYEIRRVHHSIDPDDDKPPTTTLNVGIDVDGDEIEVVDSWKDDA